MSKNIFLLFLILTITSVLVAPIHSLNVSNFLDLYGYGWISDDLCILLNNTWICILPKGIPYIVIKVSDDFQLLCEDYRVLKIGNVLRIAGSKNITVVGVEALTISTTFEKLYIYGDVDLSFDREVCALISSKKPSIAYIPQMKTVTIIRGAWVGRRSFVGSIVAGHGSYLVYTNGTHVIFIPMGTPSAITVYAVDSRGNVVSSYWLTPDKVSIYPIRPDVVELSTGIHTEGIVLPMKELGGYYTHTYVGTRTETVTITKILTRTVYTERTVTVSKMLTATVMKPVFKIKTVVRTIEKPRYVTITKIRGGLESNWLPYLGVALVGIGFVVIYILKFRKKVV